MTDAPDRIWIVLPDAAREVGAQAWQAEKPQDCRWPAFAYVRDDLHRAEVDQLRDELDRTLTELERLRAEKGPNADDLRRAWEAKRKQPFWFADTAVPAAEITTTRDDALWDAAKTCVALRHSDQLENDDQRLGAMHCAFAILAMKGGEK